MCIFVPVHNHTPLIYETVVISGLIYFLELMHIVAHVTFSSVSFYK